MYIDIEVVRWLKSRLMLGRGNVTPGDCPESVSEDIMRAVEAGTLKRLKKGVWCCCFEGAMDMGEEEKTLIFIYRVSSGPAKPLSTLMAYLMSEAPEKLGWEIKKSQIITDKQPDRAILALLPNNIRRTISERPGKRSKYTLHILKVALEKRK